VLLLTYIQGHAWILRNKETGEVLGGGVVDNREEVMVLPMDRYARVSSDSTCASGSLLDG
jgi:hypothetical protein